MKKLLYLFIILSVLCGLLVNYSMARDSDTLIVVQSTEPKGFDPMCNSLQASLNVMKNIHDTLFYPQDNGTITSALAEKWETIDDLTYKITLRKGVTFHNGEPVNTDAVKFSYDRILDPETKSFFRNKFSIFNELIIIDPYTFIIKTEKPFAPGLFQLSFSLTLVPPKYIQEVGNDKFNMQPIGCGPYKFAKWVRGEEVVLERYENYYGPKPYYTKIIFKTVPETSARVAALLTGEADVVSNIPAHQRKKIKDSGKAYLTTHMGVMPYVGINTFEPPFNDVRVRQAVNHAVNRQLINKAIFDGKALLTSGSISPRVFGADPDIKPYAYNPGKAKELLSSAGYPDGFEARLAYPVATPQFDEQAQIIADHLSKIGINVKLEPFESAVMWKLYKEKKHQLYLYWWDDTPEPDRFTYTLFHSSVRGYYYKNDKVDLLLDKARTTLDREDRAKIYHEFDRLIYDDSPWIFLYVIPDVFGVSNKVNFKGRRDGYLRMMYAKPNNN